MLNSTREPLQLYTIERTQNEYKEWIEIKKPYAVIDVSIALNNVGSFNSSNLLLKDCAYIGITNSDKPQINMLLGSSKIKYILPMGSEKVLYLEELKDD